MLIIAFAIHPLRAAGEIELIERFRVCLQACSCYFLHDNPSRSAQPRYKLMDFEDFKDVSTLPIACGALSPTGQGIDRRGWIYLDHFKPDRMLPMVTTDWTRNYLYCFSPDGKFVAQATDEGVLVISEIAEVARRLEVL